MNERLRELRNALSLSQIDFSDRIQVGSSTLAMWETGARKIKDIHISRICSEFGVNEQWLRTGEGDMFAISDDSAFDRFADDHRLDPVTRSAMLAFAKLPEDYRRIVLSAIRSVSGACAGAEDAISAEYDRANEIIEQKLRENGM